MEKSENKNSFSGFKVFLVIAFVCFILFTCASSHRVGCHCFDGTESYATGSGACSHHGGVMYWKHEYWWDKK
jgi:hypothetical protein